MQHSARQETIIWADLAKCVCIVLVVILHLEDHIAASGWSRHADIAHAWHTTNMFLRPIRLPMFFLVSGMLASQSILRPTTETTRRCLAKPMYLYFLWGTIFIVLIPMYPRSEPVSLGILARMRLVLLMASPAWYMLALAGFSCVAVVTRGWDLRWLLLACAILSLCGSFVEASLGPHTHKLARCLIFFIAGVRLRDELLAYTAAATPRLLAVSGLFFLGAGAMSAAMDRYLLPVDVMAAAFSLQFAGLVATRCPRLREPSRWLGRRTLYVYLLHFPLLVVLSAALRLNADPGLLDSWLGGMLYPIAATLVIIPACLMLGEAMRRCGFAWMFDLPRWDVFERKPAPA